MRQAPGPHEPRPRLPPPTARAHAGPPTPPDQEGGQAPPGAEALGLAAAARATFVSALLAGVFVLGAGADVGIGVVAVVRAQEPILILIVVPTITVLVDAVVPHLNGVGMYAREAVIAVCVVFNGAAGDRAQVAWLGGVPVAVTVGVDVAGHAQAQLDVAVVAVLRVADVAFWRLTGAQGVCGPAEAVAVAVPVPKGLDRKSVG